MSTITATIAGAPVTVKDQSFNISNGLGIRGVLTLVTEDASGTASYTRGQPVTFSDSVSGTKYTGFVQNDAPNKLGPASPNIEHTVTCMDNQYRLDKAANTINYLNWYAGDAALDMAINGALAKEGVLTNSALHRDTTTAQWNQGILSGVTGYGNVGDGDLELATSGSAATITENTTAEFATGTLTNTQATSNTLTPTTEAAISMNAILTLSTGATNLVYMAIWSGSMVVASNDTLHYEIWISSATPVKCAGVNLLFSDSTQLLDLQPLTDNNGISAMTWQDLSQYAVGAWYSRDIPLTGAAGKTINTVTLAFDGEATPFTPGTYQAYFRNIYLASQSGSPFFSKTATATQTTPVVAPAGAISGFSIGATTLSVVTVVASKTNAIRVSPTYAISGVNLLRSSLVAIQSVVPSNASLVVSASYDGGTSYHVCANNAVLPALPVNADVSALSLTLQEAFSTTGDDPTVFATLQSVVISLQSAPQSSKTDSVKSYLTQTDWNTGTFTSTSANSSGLVSLVQTTRDWNNNSTSGQTSYFQAGTTQSAATGSYVMTIPGGHNWDGRSRLDFVGQLTDFTLEVDVTYSANNQTGIVYRTTGWQTANNTYAYEVHIDATDIQIGYGSNTGSGAGSYTLLQSVNQAFVSGTTYHLTVAVIGNRHFVYLNRANTPILSVEDSIYAAAGYIGLREYNYDVVARSSTWDNLVITPNADYTGTWVSASQSLSGTYGNSAISWTENSVNAPIGSVIRVQTSIDGGTTYKTCTNGSPIPNFTAGQSLSGVSILYKVLLYSSYGLYPPIVSQLVSRIVGSAGTITGIRSTAPLVTDTLARGNVIGSWGTSFDGQSIAFVGTGTKNLTSNEGLIANTTGDVHAVYGSRTGTDLDSTVRFELSASGIVAGQELRYTDSNNFYRLSASTTALSIIKKVSGTQTTLQTATVALSTSTFYRLRFRVQGTNLYGKVWADGTLEPTTWTVTTTDSALASGGFALFASGTGTASFDSYRTTQYPDPALSLAPVLPRAGVTVASWNATLPTNTSLTVQTSFDGVNWSSATSGSAISGIYSQPDPTVDLWTVDSHANYTNTNKTGGSASSWTYDTTNSRITASGGSGGLFIYNALSRADVDVLITMDESDAGGLVWRYNDASNYYELGVYDDSSSGGFTNQLRLYKVASNTRTLLGTASTISFARNTVGQSPYHAIRVTMSGGTIIVYLDGTQVQQYTDGSPLSAGKMGLRNDGGTSRYYSLRMQPLGDVVTGMPSGDATTGLFVYTLVTLSTTDPSVTPQLLDLTTSVHGPNIGQGALVPQLHDPSKPFAVLFNKELDSLGQLSGDYYWNTDQTALLIFSNRNTTPAPWVLYSTDLLYAAKVTPTNTADKYRNQEIIINTVGVTGTLPEQKIADGTATSWTVAYPIYSAPTITVQGVSKMVGVKGVDTGKDYYWQANNNTITQDTGAAKIPAGYVISIVYVGQFADMVTRNNLTEQAARAAVETGTSGIVADIQDGKGMLSSNAQVYGDGLLARYGNNNTVSLVATTQRAGLVEGMILPVFLPEHQLNNRQLLITKLVTTGMQQVDGSVLYSYQITATDGPSLTNWGALWF